MDDKKYGMQIDDSLAQLVEHNTFNVGVVGSSPTRITSKTLKIKQLDKFLTAFFFVETL